MLTVNDNNYLFMVSIYGIDYHFIKCVNVVFYKRSAGDFFSCSFHLLFKFYNVNEMICVGNSCVRQRCSIGASKESSACLTLINRRQLKIPK